MSNLFPMVFMAWFLMKYSERRSGQIVDHVTLKWSNCKPVTTWIKLSNAHSILRHIIYILLLTGSSLAAILNGEKTLGMMMCSCWGHDQLNTFSKASSACPDLSAFRLTCPSDINICSLLCGSWCFIPRSSLSRDTSSAFFKLCSAFWVLWTKAWTQGLSQDSPSSFEQKCIHYQKLWFIVKFDDRYI